MSILLNKVGIKERILLCAACIIAWAPTAIWSQQDQDPHETTDRRSYGVRDQKIEETAQQLPRQKRTEVQGVAQTQETFQASLRELLANNAHNRLDSEAFKTIVSNTLGDATLTFNSCGNVNDFRHEMKFRAKGIAQRTMPLARLEYQLTKNEMKKTEMSSFSGIPGLATVSGVIRTNRIRACIHHWSLTAIRGDIEDGKLVIRLALRSTQVSTALTAVPTTYPMTKTLRMYQHKANDCPSFVPAWACALGEVGEWKDFYWLKWSHPAADMTIKDLHNVAGHFSITLSPKIANNRLSYDLTDVTWSFSGKPFTGSHDTDKYPDQLDFNLFENVPNLRTIVENYNDIQIQTNMREFITSIFEAEDVRGGRPRSLKRIMSENLTREVRKGIPASMAMQYLVPNGNNIRVTFKEP